MYAEVSPTTRSISFYHVHWSYPALKCAVVATTEGNAASTRFYQVKRKKIMCLPPPRQYEKWSLLLSTSRHSAHSSQLSSPGLGQLADYSDTQLGLATLLSLNVKREFSGRLFGWWAFLLVVCLKIFSPKVLSAFINNPYIRTASLV